MFQEKAHGKGYQGFIQTQAGCAFDQVGRRLFTKV